MSCLDRLLKLQILDLHDNQVFPSSLSQVVSSHPGLSVPPQICRIQNVSHLRELRVLNLAGNRISRLENLQGLEQLRELHLQRNRLSALVRDTPPPPSAG